MIFREPRLMPWLTVEHNILFGVGAEGKKKREHFLVLTGLKDFEKAYPFAALDYFTRKQMQKELLEIHRTEKKGVLFVTHSIDEALTLATKIVILENGMIEQDVAVADLILQME